MRDKIIEMLYREGMDSILDNKQITYLADEILELFIKFVQSAGNLNIYNMDTYKPLEDD